MATRAGARAFTLIELLVVIAVILVLAGLLMPLVSRSIASSIRTKCASRLHQLHASIIMYAKDFGLFLPPGRGYNGTINSQGPQFMDRFMRASHPSYVAERDLFYCPVHWRQPDGLWKTTSGTVIGKCWDLGVGGYFYLGNWTAPEQHLHNDIPRRPADLNDDPCLPLVTDAVVIRPHEDIGPAATPHRIKSRAMAWTIRLDGHLFHKTLGELTIYHRISDAHYGAAW